MHKITFTLVIIGGLNWLLFALTGWEIGSVLGGMDSVLARAVYVIVGLSAVYELVMYKKICKTCSPGGQA